MYVSDQRGGIINPTDTEASICGKFPDERRVAMLVETEEQSHLLINRQQLCALWPTHGPVGIRVLANYQEKLTGHPAMVLYQNDCVGRTWAHTAGRILAQFTTLYLWSLPVPVEPWLREHTREEMELEMKYLRKIPLANVLYDPLAGGANPCLRIVEMSGTRLIGDEPAVWDDMDCPELEQALTEIGIQGMIIGLNDPQLEEHWRMRTVPKRKPHEAFASYELRTGY